MGRRRHFATPSRGCVMIFFREVEPLDMANYGQCYLNIGVVFQVVRAQCWLGTDVALHSHFWQVLCVVVKARSCEFPANVGSQLTARSPQTTEGLFVLAWYGMTRRLRLD